MKSTKFLFLIIISQFVLTAAIAQKVNIETAKLVAKNHYWKMLQDKSNINYDRIVPEIVFIEKDNNIPIYYIFNISNNQSFVIVSADYKSKPILGYSLANNFALNNMPPALTALLFSYKEQIIYARSNNIAKSENITEQWETLINSPKDVTPIVPIVGPLLSLVSFDNTGDSIYWGQLYGGYNDDCPIVNNEQSITGCVATAMGQIMKFHNYPNYGTSSHIAIEDNEEYELSELTADFSSTNYNWEIISNSLADINIEEETFEVTATTQQINEVAKLLHHCGISVDMKYGVEGSSANTSDVEYALSNYFKYDCNLDYKKKNLFTGWDEWRSIIRNEIDNNRPIQYRGDPGIFQGGHSFICDGYDSDDNFHFNWGWYGLYNGWFSLTALDPNTHDYTSDQEMLVGIKLPKDQYESNNTESYASLLYPIVFNDDEAILITEDANIDEPSDKDYYKFSLPTGYDYTVDARIHDFANNDDTTFYSGDFILKYKHDDVWNNTENPFEIPTFTVNNGGEIFILVDTLISLGQTATGTYKLEVNISRTPIPEEPDILIQNLVLSSTTIEQGESLDVNCDIKNQGTSNAGNSTLKCYLSNDNTYDDSDQLLDSYNVNSLDAGNIFSINNWSINIPGGSDAGSYNLLFYADANNEITNESNEENNISTRNITVVTQGISGHNLAINYPDIYAGQPGQNVNVHFQVHNIGENTETGVPVVLELFDPSNNLISTQNVMISSIDPSNIEVFDIDLNTSGSDPEGYYTITISVNLSTDEDQGNNTLNTQIWVGDDFNFDIYKGDFLVNEFGTSTTLDEYEVIVNSLGSNSANITIKKNGATISSGTNISYRAPEYFDSDQLVVVYYSYTTTSPTYYGLYILKGYTGTENIVEPYELTVEKVNGASFNVSTTDTYSYKPNIDILMWDDDGSIIDSWYWNENNYSLDETDYEFVIRPPISANNGTYNFWVEFAQDSDYDYYQKLKINVTEPQPDFSYTIDNSFFTTAPSLTETFTIEVDTIWGFNENITLYFEDLPSGVNYTFSQNNFVPPASIDITVNIDSSFDAFDYYPSKLHMISSSRQKNLNIGFDIVDNSDNFIQITGIEYVDVDTRLDSLKINYNSQFTFDSEATTVLWQYSTDGENWIDISESQILNNQPKPQGASYIIWDIQDTPVLYSENAYFRMKSKCGSDFLEIIHDYENQDKDYVSMVHNNGVLSVFDDDENINRFSVNSDGSLSFINSQAGSLAHFEDDESLVYCYGYNYLIQDDDEVINKFSTTWSNYGATPISNDWFGLLEMEGLLYTWDRDLDILVQINSSLSATGVTHPAPFPTKPYYMVYDGKNIFGAYGTNLHKLTVNYEYDQTYTITLPSNAGIDGMELVDNYLFVSAEPNGIGHIYTLNFKDPISISYGKTGPFTINNTHTPDISTIAPIEVNEDESLINFLNLSGIVSDEDTPFEELELSLIDIDTNINVAFNTDSTALNIIPNTNWFGAANFTLTIEDDFNIIDDVVQVNVLPINDTPLLDNLTILSINEDQVGTIYLDTIVTDIDNSHDELNWNINVLGGYQDSLITEINTVYNILSIYGIQNFNKDSLEIEVSVADDLGLVDIDTLLINILPVNDYPDDFNRLFPVDNTYVMQDECNFIWSTSSDIDGDSIQYILSLNSEIIDTSFILTDTTQYFDFTPYNSNGDLIDIHWDVFAYDGFLIKNPLNNNGEFIIASDSAQFFNFSPTILANIEDLQIIEDYGDTIYIDNLNNYFGDVNNDNLTYTVVTYGTSVTSSATGSILQVSTIQDEYGFSEIIVSADDGEYFISDTFSIEVISVNDTPIISDIPGQTIDIENQFSIISLNEYISDVETEDNNISWSFTGNSNLIIDIDFSNNAVISSSDQDWFGSETITFIAEDEDGAIVSDTALFVINQSSEIPSFISDNIGVNIHPNPVTNKLFIESKIDLGNISIVNELGQIILTQNMNNTTEISVSQLKSGVYILNAYGTNGELVGKFKVVKK